MGWVRVDDHFDEHPKMARVGPIGWGIWLAGLAYCNRNLTDGFIPWTKARTLASFELVDDESRLWKLARTCGMQGDDVDSSWVINLLLDAGLWEEAYGENDQVLGYRIHDYDKYQPLKADIEAEREAKRRAGQAGGKASAEARAQAPAAIDVEQLASTNSSETQAKSNPKPNPKGVTDVTPSRRAKSATKDEPKEQDAIFEALIAGCYGKPPHELTADERGRANRAAKTLRSMPRAPTGDEVTARVEAYRFKFPRAEVTPQAISSNWSKLEAPAQNGTGHYLDAAELAARYEGRTT